MKEMEASHFLTILQEHGATSVSQQLGVKRSTVYRMKRTASAMMDGTYKEPRVHGLSKVELSYQCPLCSHSMIR